MVHEVSAVETGERSVVSPFCSIFKTLLFSNRFLLSARRLSKQESVNDRSALFSALIF